MFDRSLKAEIGRLFRAHPPLRFDGSPAQIRGMADIELRVAETTDGANIVAIYDERAGTGVALVIDTASIPERENSPLMIAKVNYGTTDARVGRIKSKVDQYATLLNIHKIRRDEDSWSNAVFLPAPCRLCIVFFLGENEWRIV